MQQTFLFPSSRQYPVDEMCTRIVDALYARNFTASGVEVSFDTYGDYQMVSKLVIPELDLDMRFHRQQGYIDPERYNCAAISDIAIPGKLLHVFADYSGPVLYVYVGENWYQDKKDFIYGLHVNSKLNQEPRTYLKYRGSAQQKSGFFYSSRLNPYLAYDNDLGRGYSPIDDEPTYYHTHVIMVEFESYLRKRVLPFIEKSSR